MNACLVDEVAKIIDPQAFSDWQSRVDFSLLKGDASHEAVAYADWISGLQPIRAKAKEIIERFDLGFEPRIAGHLSWPEAHLSFGG